MTAWLTSLRDRPIAECERRAALATVTVLLPPHRSCSRPPGPTRSLGASSTTQAPSVPRARRVPSRASARSDSGVGRAPGRARGGCSLSGISRTYTGRRRPGDRGRHPVLLRSLRAHPPLVSPAMRARHPRVLSLHSTPAPAGLVGVSALVNDGGLVNYPVGLLLAPNGGGCSSAAGGRVMGASARRTDGTVAFAPGCVRYHRPGVYRDLRCRRGGPRRELRRLRAGQRTSRRCAGPAPSAYALQSIPPGACGSTSRPAPGLTSTGAFLASIGAQECGNGDCAGVNSSGCAGPMQIAYVRGSPCSPGPGTDLVGTLRRQRAPRAGAVGQRSGGRDRHRREDSPPGHGRPGDRRLLRRIPPSRLPLLRRVRRLIGGYAEEVMARAVQYGFTGAAPPRRAARRSRSRCRAVAAARASSLPKQRAARDRQGR